MNKVMPILYKKTSTGAIQYWQIEAEGSSLITRYGQVGTENEQRTVDVITEGKNIGRSNETTCTEQAHFEAEAKWEKQRKKGYVTMIDDAESGTVDSSVIAGGILPMLAHKYKDHAKKIVFPCLGQPKLDGIRCSAIKKKGVTTLWTRTRQPIHSMPHIIAAINAMFPGDVVLDGELYNHDYCDDFENIISLVRPDEPVKGHEVVQFHIYDTVNKDTNIKRHEWLEKNVKNTDCIRRVVTFEINTAAEVQPFHDKMVAAGYEGAMLRNAAGLYVNKRSYDLQKVKVFDTDEWPIIGIEEGRGRLQGHVGSFICEMKDGKTFSAKQKGKLANLKKYFENHKLWKGKILTVQYQNFTQDGKPRFPVAIAIRD